MGYIPKMVKGLVKDTSYPIDGCTLTLSLWDYDNYGSYHLTSWDDKDDEAVMKTMHQNDKVFYDHPLEDFKKMWDSGIYEPDGIYYIDLDKVQVLEVLREENNTEKIPFIRFLWTDGEGKRKVYDTDYPTQFIAEFTDTKVTEIGGFFICGIPQKINSLDDAFKICKG